MRPARHHLDRDLVRGEPCAEAASMEAAEFIFAVAKNVGAINGEKEKSALDKRTWVACCGGADGVRVHGYHGATGKPV